MSPRYGKLKLKKLYEKYLAIYTRAEEKLMLKFAEKRQRVYPSFVNILRQYYCKFCLNIHLRRYVIGRAAKGLGSFIAGDAFLAHAKVGDLYVPVLIQQNVIELEIAVDDAARVQVEQADRYLRRVESVNAERDA